MKYRNIFSYPCPLCGSKLKSRTAHIYDNIQIKMRAAQGLYCRECRLDLFKYGFSLKYDFDTQSIVFISMYINNILIDQDYNLSCNLSKIVPVALKSRSLGATTGFNPTHT